jgi:DNA-binding NarL/FixJ family response regulator
MEIKVALFEDNKKLRESLEQLINSSETMVCTGAFPDANKLVHRMREADPDVVLMDINMPGISGNLHGRCAHDTISFGKSAADVQVSVDTVSTHIRHIYEKLQVHSKSEAVAKAILQKLV